MIQSLFRSTISAAILMIGSTTTPVSEWWTIRNTGVCSATNIQPDEIVAFLQNQNDYVSTKDVVNGSAVVRLVTTRHNRTLLFFSTKDLCEDGLAKAQKMGLVARQL